MAKANGGVVNFKIKEICGADVEKEKINVRVAQRGVRWTVGQRMEWEEPERQERHGWGWWVGYDGRGEQVSYKV